MATIYVDGWAIQLNLPQLKNHTIESFILIYDTIERTIYTVDLEENIILLGCGTENLTLKEVLEDYSFIVWVYKSYEDFLNKLVEVIKSSI